MTDRMLMKPPVCGERLIDQRDGVNNQYTVKIRMIGSNRGIFF